MGGIKATGRMSHILGTIGKPSAPTRAAAGNLDVLEKSMDRSKGGR